MLRIGIAYSLKPSERAVEADGPDDRYEEFDRPETIDALAAAIRDDGHDVRLLGDGREFLEGVLADPPDFVFNFAEGQGIGRDREARVPAVCEMLGIPYSGSDPLTLAVALDKDAAHSLLSGIVEAPWRYLPQPGETFRQYRARYSPEAFGPVEYPVILKPTWEGSSKGIRGRCIADTEEELEETLARLGHDYAQPILIERFIDGDEVTVGLIGNGPGAEVLGTLRVVPRERTERFVYSLEVKRDWRRLVSYEVPARLSPEVDASLRRAALDAYRGLGCRDVARIDFRVRDGVPYFIEANPLPGLAPVTSDLVILAEGYGIGHTELVQRILRTALARVGLGP